MTNFLAAVFRSTRHGNIQRFSSCMGFHTSQATSLYSQASLGIDAYIQGRKKTKEQFTNHIDKFKSKMTDFVTDSKNMIFTEDLRNIVHLAEPTDLELVLNMIKKFNTQSSEFRFGSFKFGPVVMRLFYFLDAPKEALQSFDDPENDGFYDQLTSYHILLDLLYNNEMYAEMYKVFDRIQAKQLNMSKFPKYPVVLILAACYKENTPKSFEYAKKLWSDMMTNGVHPLRRSATLLAALALKQGAPHIAIEVIAQQTLHHYVTIRNIKALALASLGRVDDVLPVLRQVLDVDRPGEGKHTYFQETISKVSEAVEKAKNADVTKEFNNIVTALKDRNLIDSKQTLETLLLSEITMSSVKDRPQGNLNQRQYYQQRTTGGSPYKKYITKSMV